jgi:hypothetical protein
MTRVGGSSLAISARTPAYAFSKMRGTEPKKVGRTTAKSSSSVSSDRA